MPGVDHTVELQNLLLKDPQLGTERRETRARKGTRLSFGSATIPSSCSTPWRPTGATMPNSQMGADRIDHRGLPADEEMAGAMQHQATLLFGRLGLDEPHLAS